MLSPESLQAEGEGEPAKSAGKRPKARGWLLRSTTNYHLLLIRLAHAPLRLFSRQIDLRQGRKRSLVEAACVDERKSRAGWMVEGAQQPIRDHFANRSERVLD